MAGGNYWIMPGDGILGWVILDPDRDLGGPQIADGSSQSAAAPTTTWRAFERGGSSPFPMQGTHPFFQSGDVTHVKPSPSTIPVSYQTGATRPWWAPVSPDDMFDPWRDHATKGLLGLYNFLRARRAAAGGESRNRNVSNSTRTTALSVVPKGAGLVGHRQRSDMQIASPGGKFRPWGSVGGENNGHFDASPEAGAERSPPRCSY
jgi:hypothetical protein